MKYESVSVLLNEKINADFESACAIDDRTKSSAMRFCVRRYIDSIKKRSEAGMFTRGQDHDTNAN